MFHQVVTFYQTETHLNPATISLKQDNFHQKIYHVGIVPCYNYLININDNFEFIHFVEFRLCAFHVQNFSASLVSFFPKKKSPL